jgi:chromosome segregation ATPase
MGTPDGREQMLERHEIVVRIIDTNSRRLRLDNEMHGLDIERLIAERDLAADGDNAEVRARLIDIEAKLAGLREKSSKLETEHTWLEQSLAEFDGGDVKSGRPSPAGRA